MHVALQIARWRRGPALCRLALGRHRAGFCRAAARWEWRQCPFLPAHAYDTTTCKLGAACAF